MKSINKLILHIPHSSTFLPHLEGFIIDIETLQNEILKLTDWYTDDLFQSNEDEMVIADFSRVFCDVERFADDSQEVMAQFGMGVLYEKTDEGKLMRRISPKLRDFVLEKFYWPHHNNLNTAVNKQLQSYGKAIIIDCHSFPSTPFIRDLDKTPKRPDFNIGTDLFHTPPDLVNLSKSFFENRGYSVGIDWPYKGSIVPLEHYSKNKDVLSIMLEINRSLYLQEPNNEKSTNYHVIKNITSDYLKMIREYFYK